MVMHHLIDRQIFNGNCAEAIDEFTRFLVRKVSATTSDTLMDTRHDFARLSPLGRPLFGFRELALRSCQIFLIAPKKARVSNVLARRERGKTFKPHIDTYELSVVLKSLRGDFTRKAGKPFSRRGSAKSAGFDGALNRAMQRDPDMANFGKLQNAFNYSATTRHLREGKGVVTVLAIEARIAWALAGLNPAKESF